jgi:hypothetical protein
MILSNIQLTINDKIFLKDPMSSDLGKKNYFRKYRVNLRIRF